MLRAVEIIAKLAHIILNAMNAKLGITCLMENVYTVVLVIAGFATLQVTAIPVIQNIILLMEIAISAHQDANFAIVNTSAQHANPATI